MSCCPRPRPWPSVSRRAPRARTRLPSRRSTSRSTRTWTSSWTWRPSCSISWRVRPTSWRASARSWRSARQLSRALEAERRRVAVPLLDTMPAALRARRLRMPVRAVLLALCGAAVLILVTAPGAMADALTPESGGGSENAEAIDTLYKIALFLGFLIFLLVEGVLIYVLVKHRYKRGGPAPAQIRGNTRLEIGWTVGAAVLLVVLTVVTFFFLGDIKNPQAPSTGGLNASATQYATIDQSKPPGDPKRALQVEVNGQQYLWRYRYPNGAVTYYDMVVPYDTTVILNIRSSDVVHSWWIPKLGG